LLRDGGRFDGSILHIILIFLQAHSAWKEFNLPQEIVIQSQPRVWLEDSILQPYVSRYGTPNHNAYFVALLDRQMPGWRPIRAKLNYGPLAEF